MTAAEVPARYRAPRVHVVERAMPDAYATELGQWLHQHRDALVRGGDAAGKYEWCWQVPDLDSRAPELLAPLRRRLLEGFREFAELCGVSGAPTNVELHAMVHHHGSHHDWHDDFAGDSLPGDTSPLLHFALHLTTEPVMFAGGELEFVDGTTVKPAHNQLVLVHPGEVRRIRRVECWSAHVLHGRWAIAGWIVGKRYG